VSGKSYSYAVTMPRPKFSPTDDQRRAIEAVREAQRERERRQAAAKAEMRQALAYAVTLKVPVSVLAEELGVGRDTVYRHLGRET
jgi:transcriptional regulator of acetoin/glycerol metabolism